MPHLYVGGAFAPPLTEEKLAAYRALAKAAPPEVADAMTQLLACASAWWEQPESSGHVTRPHPAGVGVIVALDAPVAKALWDHIPWTRELDSMAALFDTIDPVKDKPLRDAAHHLLWLARELDLDREPLTADKLGLPVKP